MRPIDADALLKEIWRIKWSLQMMDDTQTADKMMAGLRKAEEKIENAPTIDPVKRGRWVKRTDENCWWYECSECGDYPMKNAYGHEELSAYCPHCGARMMEGEEDE